MPLVRVKQKFQVTLPAEVREELHIEEGDPLEAVVHDDSVVLTPKAVVDKKSLNAYLTERLEELRAGKTVGPFGSMEEYDEYVRGCLKRSGCRKPTQHQTRHREVNHRLTTLGQPFIIFAQAA